GSGRRPARRRGGGRRLRRLPVHRVRTDHGRRRGAPPGRAALPGGAPLPAGHGTGDGRPARREPPRRRPAGGRRRGPGLRRVGLVVLSPAGPRHLVAPTDPARCGRRDAGGRRRRLPGGRRDHGRLSRPGRLARAARLAGPVVGAAGLPHHDPRVAGHPRPGAARHGGRPGPLPPAGGTAHGGVRMSGFLAGLLVAVLPLLAAGFWLGRRTARPAGLAGLGTDVEHATFETLHTASLATPPLRAGLTEETARKSARKLRSLLGTDALCLTDREQVLVWDGVGAHHRAEI